ncbi:DUF3435 domain protein [Colletotrichum kahawae]|uniref:DUF3435 domain protein n=1 Tax=Colletotrichum kahawae TaxID=34407 RepID=A0AAE0D7H3_COLKA|nr:DUF3435 domain protein [Colletotrichum kahawae]
MPRSDSPLPQSTIQRQPATKNDVDETFTVDRILGRWGRNLFFLRWFDGTYSWEPRENLLDDDLVETFEKEYEGFENGVQVVKTRVRKGKTEYKIRWDGRPHEEDTWVAEKDMSPNLVCRHKPPPKSQKSKRKRA